MRSSFFLVMLFMLCSSVVSTGLAGCGSDGDQGDSVLISVSGSLVAGGAHEVPDSGTVLVIWSVSSGSPDYMYHFGSGSSDGSVFELKLDADPPPEALNSYGLGVGVLILVASDYSIEDGQVPNPSEEELEQESAGASGQYAIIYKAPDAQELDWMGSFPAGYSCGKCVETGDTFDAFEPVDCKDVKIDVNDLESIEFCNWT